MGVPCPLCGLTRLWAAQGVAGGDGAYPPLPPALRMRKPAPGGSPRAEEVAARPLVPRV